MNDVHANRNKNTSNRRKRYIVNSSFQWKYSLATALIVLVMASLLSIVQFGMLHQQARLRTASPESYFINMAPMIFFFGLGFAFLAATGVCAWSIIATHRICGPIHVLNNYLIELGKNRIPHIRPLRKKDEFKELFATLTCSMDTLRAQRVQEKNAIASALQKLEALATHCDKDKREKLEQAKTDLNNIYQDIANSCGTDGTQSSPSQPETMLS